SGLLALGILVSGLVISSNKPESTSSSHLQRWLARLLAAGLLTAIALALVNWLKGSSTFSLGPILLVSMPFLLVVYWPINTQRPLTSHLAQRLWHYLLWACLVMVSYLLFLAVFAMSGYGSPPTVAKVMISIVIIGIAVLLGGKLERRLPLIFQYRPYEADQILAKFEQAAREIYDPDQLVRLFSQELSAGMKPAQSVVYLANQGEFSPVIVTGCSSHPPTAPIGALRKDWSRSGEVLDPFSAPDGLAQLKFPFALEAFIYLDASFCWEVPSTGTEPTSLLKSNQQQNPGECELSELEPLGLIVLGAKNTGASYSRQERDFLTALARVLTRGLIMARSLARRAEDERLRHELDLACEIQAILLPRELPVIDGIDLEAYIWSAREIGGDFYDVLPIDANRWGVLLGEVNGNGVTAALLTAAVLSFFRAVAAGNPSPAEILSIVNNLICLYRPAARVSVMASYGVYDRRDRTLTVANAGQTHPLLNGWAIAIDGVPLGLGNDARFAETTITLKRGDAMLWYSDGVTMALDAAGQPLGIERLLLFARRANLREDQAPWSLRDLLRKHTGNIEQRDDLSYVAMVIR
ncbi:MAG: SpoIIE family protein phosphatase, partial [Cyanobacteria bacterium NC_groundwater_1444_Ag_S-0.65um_54_12]|nr:SpoIIE family protein phosphatase [Cyanobacteria bacterium NC_groundwater_1444_Ag_S-0.65um_54_12]